MVVMRSLGRLSDVGKSFEAASGTRHMEIQGRRFEWLLMIPANGKSTVYSRCAWRSCLLGKGLLLHLSGGLALRFCQIAIVGRANSHQGTEAVVGR